MTFQVTILGSNSALPAAGRHPSAQIVNIQDELYLVDCGEGTQIQMNRYRIKRSGINHIFISHLHGDHVLGLLPLINSYALNRRKRPLYIYGPKPIQRFIEQQLECTQSHLPFSIHFSEFEAGYEGKVMENASLIVRAVPLVHRIPTLGYVFTEKQRLPHILPEQMRKYKIPFEEAPRVKRGEKVENQQGEIISHHQLTRPASPPRSYGYLSDTRYEPDLAPYLHEVDLLYHEATFLHELIERAEKTRHSTAKEAGQFAAQAKAKMLIIGHFSTRYQNLQPLLIEAQSMFPATSLAEEGLTFSVPQEEA